MVLRRVDDLNPGLNTLADELTSSCCSVRRGAETESCVMVAHELVA
jgi:hypothetical protein